MAEACINKEKTQQLYSSAVDSSSTNDTLAKPSGPSSSLTNQSKDGGVTRDPVTVVLTEASRVILQMLQSLAAKVSWMIMMP